MKIDHARAEAIGDLRQLLERQVLVPSLEPLLVLDRVVQDLGEFILGEIGLLAQLRDPSADVAPDSYRILGAHTSRSGPLAVLTTYLWVPGGAGP